MTHTSRVALLTVVLLGCAAFGQTPTGTPPFSSVAGGGVDSIDLGNLNVHVSIPIVAKAGSGLPFHYTLSYDSSIWVPTTVSGQLTWQPVTNWGWRGVTEGATGYITYATSQTKCFDDPNGYYYAPIYSNWAYHDPGGTIHPIGLGIRMCLTDPGTGSGTAADGSGYTVTADMNVPTASVLDTSGTTITPPRNATTGNGSIVDRNGNQITTTNNGTSFTDTLATTALSISGSPNPTTYQFTAPGGSASYTVTYSSLTVQTAFGCTGIAEYPATLASLPTKVTLPDGNYYAITYEPTPGNPANVTGRIASIRVPTEGTISYTYTGSNNGMVCADASTYGLNRQTPDGTSTYSRPWSSGTIWLTEAVDPEGNYTHIYFQTAGGSYYETQRDTYRGQFLAAVQSLYHCYNGNGSTANCYSTPVTLPITRRTAWVQWPGGLTSETDTHYDSNGLVTEVDEYDYGAASATRKTLTTYANPGNNIVGLPASITIQDGGGITLAQTNYTYDTHGNATSVSQVVGAGANPLSRSFTYNANGTVATATDVNGAATSYSYGSGSCNGAFPTGVSEPLALSRSMTWDCNGGVQVSVTDENGRLSSTTYTDASFWRPSSSTDRANNVTTYSYSSISADSQMSFGLSSVVESLLTVDSLGRTKVQQRRQGPGAAYYDSVSTAYDASGRPSLTSIPYSGTAEQWYTTHGTSTSYDPISRPLTVTDAGGGSVSYSYSSGSSSTYVTQTLGPAPPGENAKQKVMQYDALGRLTGVCEVTTASGSGSCGQTGKQGYWTTYAYDVLGNLLTVSQNGSQSRSYTYDGLSRMTSETNPETGTTTYTYDTDTPCGRTYKGDLIKRVDAMGNITCHDYDALHRVIATSYAGPYGNSMYIKSYVYDASSAGGFNLSNTKGRLAEAYTGPSANKVTDVVFNYSPRGEVTDTWQATQHSGGYYHVTASYWANGALNTLGGLPGMPTLTYNVDGEGRVATVSDSTPQTLATATNYTVLGQVGTLTFGSGDADTFSYDYFTNRMTQYQYTVGATPQAASGTLTWNPNGTLAQLAISDQLNSANSQLCTYAYDDLARLAGANCGSAWTQTFGYDPLGNISKSGSVSFQPTYNTATNRISSAPFTYDANGNTLTDNVHSYTWDAEGKAITADGLSLTYDALGRMVEQGGTTQIVYSPAGQKFALMTGQTVSKAFVPLPGGAQAVYSGTTLAYFRHPDWLGSARLGSTPTRTVLFDLAYAPFGETYAESGSVDRSFTGQNQDTIPGSTAGLYDFLFRQHAQYGRWTSPDPAGMDATDAASPQTWNRFAYVINNPLISTDPQGLDMCLDSGGNMMSGSDGENNVSCLSAGGTWVSTPPSGQGETANVNATVQPVQTQSSPVPDFMADGTVNFLATAGQGQAPAPGQGAGAGPDGPTNNAQPNPCHRGVAQVTNATNVPPASPQMQGTLSCISSCTGEPLVVTSTSTITPIHPQNTPHARGQAADVRYIPGISDLFMQCAGACGAQYALDEFLHPSRHATGPHFHVQMVPSRSGGHGDLPANNNLQCQGR